MTKTPYERAAAFLSNNAKANIRALIAVGVKP